jgi:K+-sensing histidine kinase KdpD
MTWKNPYFFAGGEYFGLGLTIVRHLVDLHSGTIKAASGGEGMGAIFTVDLPLFIKTAEEKIPKGKKAANSSKR